MRAIEQFKIKSEPAMAVETDDLAAMINEVYDANQVISILETLEIRLPVVDFDPDEYDQSAEEMVINSNWLSRYELRVIMVDLHSMGYLDSGLYIVR